MNENQKFITQTEVLKNSINLLNQFLEILGAFNQAVIVVKIHPKERIDLDSIISNYPKEFYNVEILKIEHLEKRLTENFNWLKEHTLQYGASNFLNQRHGTFNKKCFEKLLNTIRLQVQNYCENWANEITEVVADSKDGTYYRDLVIYGENKSVIVDFAIVIH